MPDLCRTKFLISEVFHWWWPSQWLCSGKGPGNKPSTCDLILKTIIVMKERSKEQLWRGETTWEPSGKSPQECIVRVAAVGMEREKNSVSSNRDFRVKASTARPGIQLNNWSGYNFQFCKWISIVSFFKGKVIYIWGVLGCVCVF